MGEIRRNIARNILFYRKKKHWTQKQLAEKLNIKNSAISNWEKELNSPDIETLFEMCDLFGISISEMYGVGSNTNDLLSPDEKNLLDDYRSLNDQGQELVRQQMELIVISDKYKKYAYLLLTKGSRKLIT